MNTAVARALIEERGIIPSLRIRSTDDARFVAETIIEAGIPIVEITMTVPQAPEPGLPGSIDVSAESRIAALSRSRIAAPWLMKSVAESPAPFRGCQAKPKWSCARPMRAS